MNENKKSEVPAESPPGVLESTAAIATAYATACYDNVAQSLETLGHIAKLPHDEDFAKAATEELAILEAATTARGAVAEQVTAEAVEDIKANFAG